MFPALKVRKIPLPFFNVDRSSPRLTTLGKIKPRLLNSQSSDEFKSLTPFPGQTNSTAEKCNRQSRHPPHLTTLGKIKPRLHNSHSSDEFKAFIPIPSPINSTVEGFDLPHPFCNSIITIHPPVSEKWPGLALWFNC